MPAPLRLAAVLVACALPLAAPAKDNSRHTVGVGFQGTSLGVVPGTLLSAKFAAAPTAEFAALFGFTLTPASSVAGASTPAIVSIAFGGKALLILVPEEHVNLYVAASVLPAVGTFGLHSFSYFAGPGLSYYPPGAPNVEVFAEFGFGGSVRLGTGAGDAGLGGNTILTTLGSVALGVHYWF